MPLAQLMPPMIEGWSPSRVTTGVGADDAVCFAACLVITIADDDAPTLNVSRKCREECLLLGALADDDFD